MTRIDLKIKRLADVHIDSNLRESMRPLGKVIKRLERYDLFLDVPLHYQVQPFSEKFFFTRIKWLESNYKALMDEYYYRHGKVSPYAKNLPYYEDSIALIKELQKKNQVKVYNDWKPTEKDIKVWQQYMINIIVPRLKRKIKYDGFVITKDQYINLLLTGNLNN